MLYLCFEIFSCQSDCSFFIGISDFVSFTEARSRIPFDGLDMEENTRNATSERTSRRTARRHSEKERPSVNPAADTDCFGIALEANAEGLACGQLRQDECNASDRSAAVNNQRGGAEWRDLAGPLAQIDKQVLCRV